MKRRNFLKAAVAAIPCTGLHDVIALSQASASPDSGELHIVAEGKDRFSQPIDMGFSTMFFKVASSDANGGLFIIEHKNLGHAGPPLHLHVAQEEWFYVLEGNVAFQVGEQRFELKAGESILAPRQVPHAFAGTGSSPARMLIAFTPAGKMEACFRDNSTPHSPAERAAYFKRFGMEYIGPSPFVSGKS